MMTFSGEVTLMGVSEKDLFQILQHKIANEGQIRFDPTTAKKRTGGMEPPIFDQVVIAFATVQGMKLVDDLLASLQSP